MAAKRDLWTTVSLKPLSGLLDTRSRPADIPVGAFRYKSNISITDEGKICRRDGFQRGWADILFDNAGVPLTAPGNHIGRVYHNHDWHHRGGTREPIIFGFESQDSTGFRRFFAGTQSRLAILNEATGYYTDLLTGVGAFGSYWTAADATDSVAGDLVLFTNGVDDIQYYNITAQTVNTVPDLVNIEQVRKAKIVINFEGFTVLMNISAPLPSGGPVVPRPTTVQWSDFGKPLSWQPGTGSQANFQDLPYGDDILAAGELLGAIYIFTRRAIWRMTLSGDTNTTFAFTRVYVEKKNEYRCLTFPRTLVSDGQSFYYLTRDAIFMYNPYIAQPERPDQTTTDWVHRASGVIYRKADTAMSGVFCNSPCAEFRPSTKEMWVSWPLLNAPINGQTLVLQLEQKTADVVDAGFSMFVNYRRNPVAGFLCNESQDFLAASSVDYSLKEIGSVFFREYLMLINADPTQDLPLNSDEIAGSLYGTVGYNSVLRGMVPLGLTDRQKILRNVLLDHDTSFQNVPCQVQLRIGNSYNLVDPNDLDNECAPQWRNLGVRPLQCPDPATLSAMTAKNQKPDRAMTWNCYEANRFLWWELTIQNDARGSLAIGADSCFERVDFLALSMEQSQTV